MTKITLSDTKTKSNNANNVTDIPSAGPLTTAINGFEKLMKALTKSLK